MAEGQKAKENGGVDVAAVAAAAVAEIDELPKTIVRRLVKDKLSQLSPDSDLPVHREAQQAFCESGRIFIHYLSATANDVCKDSKRQIINAEDVLKALEEMEFTEFIEPLRDCLEEFRQKNAAKKSRLSKESNGESKGTETLEAEGEDDEDVIKSDEEPRKKNNGGNSSVRKESKGKGKRKEPPAADTEENKKAADTSDEGDRNADTS